MSAGTVKNLEAAPTRPIGSRYTRRVEELLGLTEDAVAAPMDLSDLSDAQLVARMAELTAEFANRLAQRPATPVTGPSPDGFGVRRAVTKPDESDPETSTSRP